MASFSDKFVGAIDQGTTSSRFILFNQKGDIVSVAQQEFTQITPNEGECEHDPMEILNSVNNTIAKALDGSNPKNTLKRNILPSEVSCVGVTNQRETTVVWNRQTGNVYYNALVWMDMRTKGICDKLISSHADGQDQLRGQVGLPISPYFAGTKLMWVLSQPDKLSGAGTVKDAAERGEVMFGTIDTWLLWNMTGGVSGGVHVTDVTNASRTLLMDIKSCTWNETICNNLGIPTSVLPTIKSSSEVYGQFAAFSPLAGVRIAGILGDQQAALFGQAAYTSGQAKNTYGTGCFMLVNTGTSCVPSTNGLLTTVAFKLGAGGETHYALEGSVAFAGASVQWLRDNLNVIENPAEVSANAAPDNGGVYFVPAFSGLYAPYWKDHARGAIVGLTRYATKGHLLRATMEAVCFQTKEVFDAMIEDCKEQKVDVRLSQLKVDGGMTVNNDIMQAQANILETEVVRPTIVETTALGAAYAAGLAVGFWGSLGEISNQWKQDVLFKPEKSFASEYGKWKRAVRRTMFWECDEEDDVILKATM
jgi:glycerol kinase